MTQLDKKVRAIILVLLGSATTLLALAIFTTNWYQSQGTLSLEEGAPAQSFSYRFGLLGTESCEDSTCESNPSVEVGRTLFGIALVLIAAIIVVFFSTLKEKYRRAPAIFLAIATLLTIGFAVPVMSEFASRAPGQQAFWGWSSYLFMVGGGMGLVASILLLFLPNLNPTIHE